MTVEDKGAAIETELDCLRLQGESEGVKPPHVTPNGTQHGAIVLLQRLAQVDKVGVVLVMSV